MIGGRTLVNQQIVEICISLLFSLYVISLSKHNNEITYKENNKLIKFTPNQTTLLNREKRAERLYGIIPENLQFTKYFMSYDWEEGKTLYDIGSVKIYKKFLNSFSGRFFR